MTATRKSYYTATVVSDITDELLAVAVGCREAGVSRQEAFGIVRDVYAAPWDSHAAPTRDSLALRLVENVFGTPRAGGLDTFITTSAALPSDTAPKGA